MPLSSRGPLRSYSGLTAFSVSIISCVHGAREELRLSGQERREAAERRRTAAAALARAEREAREAAREAERAERRGDG